MRRIILHLGLPKTGTTSLQNNVFKRMDGFEYLGRPYVNNEIEGVFCSILNDSEVKFEESLAGCIKTLNKYIGKKDVLVSSEGLTNSLLTQASNLSSNTIFSRLHSVFSGFGSLEVMLTVRNQISIIPSYYAQFEKEICFDDFLEKGLERNYSIFDNLYYHRMFTELFNIFGEENVHCLVYEELVDNNKLFAKRLALILRVDSGFVLDGVKTVLNKKSISDGVHESSFSVLDMVVILKKRLFKGGLGVQKYKVTKKMMQLLKKITMSRSLVGLSKIQKENVIKKYHEDNVKLKSILMGKGIDVTLYLGNDDVF